MKRLFVIAPSYEQYRYWMLGAGHTTSSAQYISSTEKILGLEISLDQLVVLGPNPDVDMRVVHSRIRKPSSAPTRKKSSKRQNEVTNQIDLPLY